MMPGRSRLEVGMIPKELLLETALFAFINDVVL
jgi:hypothetical protein